MCFTFDLPLPADFTPTSLDGETENFELWDLDRVAAAVANVGGDGTLFKPNCNLVVIDFLDQLRRLGAAGGLFDTA